MDIVKLPKPQYVLVDFSITSKSSKVTSSKHTVTKGWVILVHTVYNFDFWILQCYCLKVKYAHRTANIGSFNVFNAAQILWEDCINKILTGNKGELDIWSFQQVGLQ